MNGPILKSMSGIRRLLDAADTLARRGVGAVLATVVRVDGSSYRRPGARMLIGRDGSRLGTISGGCLERDLAEHAFFLTDAGPVTIAYDTRPGGAHAGLNLGCEGVVHVLLERLGGPDDPLAPLREVLDTATPAALATVYRATSVLGGRTLFRGTGVPPASATSFNAEERGRDARATEAAALTLRDGLPRTVALPAGGEALVERLDPPPPLLIFGAGEDAQPVADIAAAAGFAVTVIDRRPGLASRDRFPRAAATLTAEPDALADLPLSSWSAAVVMSHRFDDDGGYLAALLRSPVGFVGLLGSKRRAARLLTDLHRRGVSLGPAELSRLHAPVGLDLGSRGPEEIALSVVAEVVAWRNGRRGGPLGERHAPIYDRPAAG